VIGNLTEIEAKLVMVAKNLPAQLAMTKAIWTNGKGEGVVRPFHTPSLHSFWSYPMGVTLYGMLMAGRFYQNDDWLDYTLSSLKQICDWDQFCLWDKTNYHYPSINTQLYWLEALDDCGAFGAFMLEAQKELGLVTITNMSDRISHFMSDWQRREKDGAFSRDDDTMWIDDLYMSVPFLVRRFETSGNHADLEDAVWQFLAYKKRFFDSQKQLMSHIFDPILNKGNLIPWSRGNGWVLFALSELLQVLPTDHKHAAELIDFFNDMLRGILKVQDSTGLWHQVLDEPTSYLESSATAMFIVGMARSLRQGYCDSQLLADVRTSINLAWAGLKTYCIDKEGNLYGVCQGSGYSFSKNYYQSLGWLKNDPHGIGIVVLAGVEIEKLKGR
jgi:rhamnogalacturonyl hydrolase YesR